MKKIIFSLTFSMFICAAFGESRTSAVFLEGDGAVLERLPYTVEIVGKGENIFLDRNFTFLAPPEGLQGKPFFKLSIDGNVPVCVAKEGLLTVITPKPPSSCSNVKQLEDLGFVWIQAPEDFQCFGEKTVDRCRIYQRRVKKGESFQFGRWTIYAGFSTEGQFFYHPPARVKRVIDGLMRDTVRLDAKEDARDMQVNRPDYVVFIPHQPRDKTKRDLSKPGDTYNDHFQVIERNGKLFAFWTQASKESDIDQHIAFSKSLDKGETWTDPVILAGSPNKKNPALRASWQQPMFSKSGRIYVLWNQQNTSMGPHRGAMFGAFSDDEGEIWSAPQMVFLEPRMDWDDKNVAMPPSWCNWQRPLRLGPNGKYLVGSSRHGRAPYDPPARITVKSIFMRFENIDDDPPVSAIRLRCFATNGDALKIAHPGELNICEEPSLVKLPDGRLFALMRTSSGHPEWSQSRDQGETWTQPRPLLNHDGGTAYLHPTSPCPMYDWKGCEAGSGFYFALVHNTTNSCRGPLYLIAGKFNSKAEQPIEFAEPKLFAPRVRWNSFYTSYTILDGKGILWFPDVKFYLLGREIGEEWFRE